MQAQWQLAAAGLLAAAGAAAAPMLVFGGRPERSPARGDVALNSASLDPRARAATMGEPALWRQHCLLARAGRGISCSCPGKRLAQALRAGPGRLEMWLPLKLAAAALCGCAIVVLVAYFGQRKLIYFPDRVRVPPAERGLTGV